MDETPASTTDDERFVPLSELVAALVVDDGRIGGEDVGVAMKLERIAVEFPVELQLEAGADGLVLRASPPTQHVATGVLPVWHGLRVTVVETEVEGDDAAR
jgi:hypothetical protein